MRVKTFVLVASLALVALAFVLPSAQAAPVPYVCSSELSSSCGGDVCYAPSSTQAPRCYDVPGVTTTFGYCTEGHSPCSYGKLACVTNNGKAVACVPDPCATTACTASSAPLGASVKLVCIEGQQGCPSGELVCTLGTAQVCVPDPCYTTRCFGDAASVSTLL